MNTSRLVDILPPAVMAELQPVITRFEINTPRRLAHFLAQCGHESAGFKRVVENLNYSDPARIVQVFRKFDKDKDRVVDSEEIAYARGFIRNPEKLANYVYANRMGNGSPESGDGFRFCGRGYIQLTGRDNYTAFNRFVPEDIIATPRLVATKYPLFSAGWFWHTNRLNALADTGTVEQVTRRVNGGTHGLADRTARYNRLLPLLTPSQA